MNKVLEHHIGKRMSDEAFIHRAFVVNKLECVPFLALQYLRDLRSGLSRDDVWRNISQGSIPIGMVVDHSIYDHFVSCVILLDHEKFIEQAYLKILGRMPDDSGNRHYIKRLKEGENKKRVLLDLLLSNEGQARIKSNPMLKNFELYLRHQFGAVGVLSVGKILQVIFCSSDIFLRKAYLSILSRDPDKSGLEAYGEAIRRGMSKLAVVGAMVDSDEGRKRKKTFAVYILVGILRIPRFFS